MVNQDNQSSPNQPVAPDSSSQQTSAPPVAKKSNRILLAVILAIVGALAVGGGAFAYFNYFPTPEKVLEKTRARIPAIKSFEFSGQVDSEIKMSGYLNKKGNSALSFPLLPGGKDSKISIKLDGLFDKNDAKNPKAAVNLNLETDLVPMIKLAVGLKSRVIDKAVYIQFEDLPNLGFFDLSKANNQWIKLDNNLLRKKDGVVNYENRVNKIIKNPGLSPEQKEKISNLFKRINYARITKKFPGEKINGISVHHYSYLIDKEGLKQFYIEAMKITKPEMLTQDFIGNLNRSVDTLGSINGEVWIGKKDFFPYKITFELNPAETETSPAGKVNSVFSLKNFNKPMQIEIPAPVKTIEEIMSGLYGGFKGFTPAVSSSPVDRQGAGNNADADQDGLSDQLEKAYGTDPNKADTDGDGFKDGDEIKKGYNPNGPGRLAR